MQMKKRVLSVALCFMMAVACLMPAVNVKADGDGNPQLKYKKNRTYTLVKYKKTSVYFGDIQYAVDLGKKLDEITSMSVSSSKKSVVKIRKNVYTDGTTKKKYGYFTVEPKKAGTTKIKVKVKKNGKKYTYTFKVKVVNYANPFKSIKVGKKNLASKYKKSAYYNFAYNGKTAKFSIKSAKNWKVKKIQYVSINAATSKWVTKKVKNGFKIPTTAKGKTSQIIVTMRNNKTKAVDTFYLTLSAK